MPISLASRAARAAVAALALGAAACRADAPRAPTAAERAAIADTLRRLVARAYDLAAPDPVERMLSLYPDSGRVVSAAAGSVVTSRDTLRAQLAGFWERIGQNMRDPRWVWDTTIVDVLAPDAAVLTGIYRIPHRTPRGEPHEVGGAWTAVFVRRDGRWVIVQEHLSSR
jgi:uncharacterized protein (TIGR02246 family)